MLTDKERARLNALAGRVERLKTDAKNFPLQNGIDEKDTKLTGLRVNEIPDFNTEINNLRQDRRNLHRPDEPLFETLIAALEKRIKIREDLLRYRDFEASLNRLDKVYSKILNSKDPEFQQMRTEYEALKNDFMGKVDYSNIEKSYFADIDKLCERTRALASKLSQAEQAKNQQNATLVLYSRAAKVVENTRSLTDDEHSKWVALRTILVRLDASKDTAGGGKQLYDKLMYAKKADRSIEGLQMMEKYVNIHAYKLDDLKDNILAPLNELNEKISKKEGSSGDKPRTSNNA